ncbi:hypothetical protein CORC01_06313 [Colletotrichum orchidophilum]|uniref:Uncharacterized protein n=1 Tax=Colletotrichum orchidophilum TaxID=1209926 RepID=A0A1G4BA70_9PEZI|nr:uncharacterized protein CORC01_06313 [Colletotrichum orchidophilum]OHE98317.1 hypothetical protein CORC01_06313 [Colletotrichum orchidophilum]
MPLTWSLWNVEYKGKRVGIRRDGTVHLNRASVPPECAPTHPDFPSPFSLKDDDTAIEDWNRIGASTGAFKHVEGWEPIVRQVIKSTPNRETTD